MADTAAPKKEKKFKKVKGSKVAEMNAESTKVEMVAKSDKAKKSKKSNAAQLDEALPETAEQQTSQEVSPESALVKEPSSVQPKKQKKSAEEKDAGPPAPEAVRKIKRGKRTWEKYRKDQKNPQNQKAPWESIPIEPKVKPIKPFTQGREIGYLSNKRLDDLPVCEPAVESLKAQKPTYTNWTEPQSIILPAMLDTKHDTLAFAKKHTGRSLAYGMTLLTAFGPNAHSPSHPLALILTEDHQRAVHIRDEISLVTRFRKAHCMLLTTGRTIENDKAQFGWTPHIVICHPQRLLDHMRETPSFSDFVENPKIVIVDQLDVLIKTGNSEGIAGALANVTNEKRRVIMVSGEDSPSIRKFALKNLRPEPNIVSGLPVKEQNVREKVHQEYFIVQPKQRPHLFLTLLKELQKTENHKILVYFQVAEEAVYYATLVQEVMKVEPIQIHMLREEGLTESQFMANRNRIKTEDTWFAFVTDPNNRLWRVTPIDGTLATTIVHFGTPLNPDRYVRRLGTEASQDKFVAQSIMVGLPCEELYVRSMAEQFKIEASGLPVTPPKLQQRVDEALKRRALANANQFEQRKAVSCWKAWLGFMKSQRPLFTCTSEFLVKTGNEVFGTMYADPKMKAPEIKWSWACQVGLRSQESLNLASRGLLRTPHVDLYSSDEEETKAPVSEETKKKNDLMALVKKLKEGAEATKKAQTVDDDDDDEDVDEDEKREAKRQRRHYSNFPSRIKLVGS